jgi:hypothetical protein
MLDSSRRQHHHRHHHNNNGNTISKVVLSGGGGGQVFPRPAVGPPLPKLFLSSDSETETSERGGGPPNTDIGGSLWDHADLAGPSTSMAFPPQSGRPPAVALRAADMAAAAGHKNGGPATSSGRLAEQKQKHPPPTPQQQWEARTVLLKLTVPANTPVPPARSPALLAAARPVGNGPLTVPGREPDMLISPQRRMGQPPASPLPGRPLSPVVIFTTNNNNSKQHRNMVQPTITRTSTEDATTTSGHGGTIATRPDGPANLHLIELLYDSFW